MVLDICSYIISGKLILILLFSSKLVFLPICIVEMYVYLLKIDLKEELKKTPLH